MGRRRFRVRQGTAAEPGRGRQWRIRVEGGSIVSHERGFSNSNIVAPLRYAGAFSLPTPLAGVSSGVVDGEVAVSGKAGGGSEG